MAEKEVTGLTSNLSMWVGLEQVLVLVLIVQVDLQPSLVVV
jgi:hypothetical protein